MIEQIIVRYNAILHRVDDLLLASDELTKEIKPEFESHVVSDVQRAAVVLLHAALEVLLRSLAEWKMPHGSKTQLENIPLWNNQSNRKTTFSLCDLAEHRGLSVSELIAKSVTEHLDRKSFNNLHQVLSLLKSIGLTLSLEKELASKLAALMSRRHLIAHRADWIEVEGRPEVERIDRETVADWLVAVESFGWGIMDLVRTASDLAPGETS